MPVGLLLGLAYSHGVTPKRFGLRTIAENESWVHFVGLVTFLAVVLWLVHFVTAYISASILPPAEVAPFYKSIAPDGLLRFPVVLYLAVTAGFVEEIFFRGLPLLYLQERFPRRALSGGYVLVTAVLFGAGHWENGSHAFIATFVYGVFSSALYLRLRDLWPLIGAHILIDLWGFW